LQITIAFLLVPRYGYMGAAIANTSAVVVVNVARIVQLQRRLHIHPFSWSLGKPLAAAAVALVVAALMWKSSAPISAVRLVLLWAAMVFAYAGTLYAFGLDHHSRLAWNHLRASLGRRFGMNLIDLSVGKEAQ
jgi:O-antigen/teichoic acid export membrane protein